jgi:3-hydroxybutyryl-CoA dehydratase
MSDVAIGTRIAFRKTVTSAEQALFTGISGNLGALYVDANRAKAEGAPGMIAFELVLGALATTCLSRRIGRLDLRFLAPVPVGGSVEAAAEVTASENGALTLRIAGTLDGFGPVMEGEAELLPFRAAA